MAIGLRITPAGKTYPRPIVDHADARQRFLAIARATLSGA
jgi:hypothetical protein